MSEAPKTPPQRPELSLEELNRLIADLDKFHFLMIKLYKSTGVQTNEFLLQQASMAFAKTSMSLLGFLRFVPPSKFYAREAWATIDLSSASVMARQALEDALSFFYLAELGLTPEEKEFRKLVWEYHGLIEGREVVRIGCGFTDLPNFEGPLAQASLDQRRQAIVNHSLFSAITDSRVRDRVKNGTKNRVLRDNQILERRRIPPDRYDFPYKMLSNFSHFSMLSSGILASSVTGWNQIYGSFWLPAVDAAYFIGETIGAFIETFPGTGELLSEGEKSAVKNLRLSLRCQTAKGQSSCPIPASLSISLP